MAAYDPRSTLADAERAICDHDYKCVYEGWESETYQCEKCGDRYKLYDDEMK